MNYKRKSLPSTTLDKAMYLMDALIDIQLLAVVRIHGRFDVERLRIALRLLVEEEPRLGCRFVPGRWTPRWERIENLDVGKLLTVHKEDADEDRIRQVALEQLDCYRGPQIRVWLFQSQEDSEKDVVCVGVSHILTDAGGLKDVLYRLSAFYRDLCQGNEARTRQAPDLPRSLKSVLKQIGFKGLHGLMLRHLRDLRGNLFPLSSWRFPAMARKPSDRRYVVHHLDGSRFQNLRNFASIHGAIINDVIQAAWLRANHRLIRPSPSQPLRMITTVDLRRYISKDKVLPLANLSAFAYPNIGHNLGKDLVETAYLVRNEMRRHKSLYIGLSIFPMIVPLLHLLPSGTARGLLSHMVLLGHRARNIPPAMTNMGKIDAKKLDFGDISVHSAYCVTPLIYPPLFSMGFSGHQDSLTFSSGFCASGVNPNDVERLYEYFFDELPT